MEEVIASDIGVKWNVLCISANGTTLVVNIAVGLMNILFAKNALLPVRGCYLSKMNANLNDVFKCPSCGAPLVTDEMSRWYRCPFCGLDVDYWERRGRAYTTFRVEKGLLVIFDEAIYRQ